MAISAWGKTAVPSRVVRPWIWSWWQWVTITSPTFAGSSPAAAMFAGTRPAVALIWPPVPASKAISWRPVSTKVTV